MKLHLNWLSQSSSHFSITVSVFQFMVTPLKLYLIYDVSQTCKTTEAFDKLLSDEYVSNTLQNHQKNPLEKQISFFDFSQNFTGFFFTGMLSSHYT